MNNPFINFQNPKGVMGLNKRNIDLIYEHNMRKNYKFADDKVKAKLLLHEKNLACAETYAIISKMKDVKSSWKKCSEYNGMAIKPANGSGGGGIKIITKDSNGNWISGGKVISESEILYHISSIIFGYYSRRDEDTCLIEELIYPHPFFAEIYKSGVPDFRIITLRHRAIMAMLRMPTSQSNGMANLHQKGVGIGIDMSTGTLTEVYDGEKYSNKHPDNDVEISGKLIPFWKELNELAVATSKAFPLDYLGIDLVIDKDKGPQVMEVNVRPGLAIQMVNKIGLQHAVDAHFIPKKKIVARRKNILAHSAK